MSRAPHTMREFQRAVEAAGYTIERRKRSKHPHIARPNGSYMMSVPITPSDYRALRNCWAQFQSLHRTENSLVE